MSLRDSANYWYVTNQLNALLLVGPIVIPLIWIAVELKYAYTIFI
jgi:hypothetical protein